MRKGRGGGHGRASEGRGAPVRTSLVFILIARAVSTVAIAAEKPLEGSWRVGDRVMCAL